ncbi:MAG: Smr/MutS family protein [Burkholderiales bacterium]|nr:Smr/MutS family protein [Burkholderiales bacterium]
MAKTKPPAADDDPTLFREAVKDVAPLRRRERVQHAPEHPPPVPTQRIQDERQVLQDSLSDAPAPEMELESGEVLSFLREGMSPQVLRRLRAGFWAVQQEIDLHGLRTEEARPLLVGFLDHARRRGARCVRVIHGKGLGSRNREPVLKPRVASWLIQRKEVLAFCEARPEAGGSGAVLVLLRGIKPDGAQRADGDDGD